MINRCIFSLLSVFCLTTFCGCTKLTTEERINTYEVVSVSQYTKQVTNNFGGVIDTEVCYQFSYIDDGGGLHNADNFQHHEYGLTKICLGDKNEYVVVNEGFDIYRYLYLSKDTLSSLTKLK